MDKNEKNHKNNNNHDEERGDEEKGEEGIRVYVPEEGEYLGDAEIDVKNESLKVDRCVCLLYSE